MPSNPVVVTGDIHSSWVHDLKADFGDPKSAIVGTEFVGTSISSRFDPPYIPYVMAALPGNSHTKFFDGAQRGYVRCQLTRQQWRTDFRVVPTVRETGSVVVNEAAATTLASFVVAHGRAGAEKA
jgi:alkaline phosphatase D